MPLGFSGPAQQYFCSFSFVFLQVWRFIPIFANVIYGLTLKKTAYGNIANDITDIL